VSTRSAESRCLSPKAPLQLSCPSSTSATDRPGTFARAINSGSFSYAMYSDWEVARWLSRLPWPFTHSSAHTFVVDATDDLARGTGCMLAMIESQNDTFVGIVNLRIPALEPQPWTTDAGLGILGYGVTRERWSAGFASEGAACATAFAFERLALSRLRQRSCARISLRAAFWRDLDSVRCQGEFPGTADRLAWGMSIC
jgi:RimJ/RimL family protein N-acetyltransferase